ncbi:MAG: glucokinase [archaeon]
MTNVLAADIGGTNARFAIANEHGIVWRGTYSSGKPFMDTLAEVLKTTGRYTPRIACFAVAGPISPDGSTCFLTNAKWKIDAKLIQKKTSLNSVILINDFEAIGYAMNALDQKSITYVQGKLKKLPERVAIIGAGTGLGHVFAFCKEGTYTAIPSEAGSSLLMPQNSEEYAFAEFLKTYDELPEIESIVSGRGIVRAYVFYAGAEPAFLKDVPEEEKPAAIMRNYTKDPLAKKAFSLFERFYGYQARNYCVSVLAQAVLIAGGIAAKNEKIFGKDFITAFRMSNVPSIRDILKNTPVGVITDQDVGLKGAAWVALTKKHKV